jgi:hypothetical protein
MGLGKKASNRNENQVVGDEILCEEAEERSAALCQASWNGSRLIGGCQNHCFSDPWFGNGVLLLAVARTCTLHKTRLCDWWITKPPCNDATNDHVGSTRLPRLTSKSDLQKIVSRDFLAVLQLRLPASEVNS